MTTDPPGSGTPWGAPGGPPSAEQPAGHRSEDATHDHHYAGPFPGGGPAHPSGAEPDGYPLTPPSYPAGPAAGYPAYQAGPGHPAFGLSSAYPFAAFDQPAMRSDYAHWGRRVGASLLDSIPGLAASVVFGIGYVRFVLAMVSAGVNEDPRLDFGRFVPWVLAGSVVYLLALGWSIWDRYLLGGRTGQTIGKRVLRISLIAEQTGRPIGAVNAFIRDLVHTLDGIAYVGYLWPLWDEKRQTFADKLMKTIVVDVAENAPISISTERVGSRPGAF